MKEIFQYFRTFFNIDRILFNIAGNIQYWRKFFNIERNFQYLGKFLEELRQQKTHFKQSLNKQLVVELESFSKNLQSSTIDSTAGAGGLNYKSRGIGSMAVGVYLDVNLQHSSLPVDEGYPRFTVRDPNAPKYFTYGGQATPPHY